MSAKVTFGRASTLTMFWFCSFYVGRTLCTAKLMRFRATVVIGFS